MLRANGTNQAAPKTQVTTPFLFRIGSSMEEHVEKPDEHRDGALLKRSDWCFLFVETAASGLEVKRIVGRTRDDATRKSQ